MMFLRITDMICSGNDSVDREPLGPARDRDAGILHLVGVMTEEVFGFVERATSAMVEMNVAQTVIALEDPRYARLSHQLHSSVTLISVPGSGLTKARAWIHILRTFRALVAEQDFDAVHLHGFLPCLLGGYIIARTNLPARVVYSPHASKSLGPAQPLGIAARRLLSDSCALARQVSVASIPSEARELYTVMARPVEVVENEIGAAFFEVMRNEARRPLVVTAGRREDRRSVEVFTQAAVLLGGAHLRAQFNWCGPTDPKSHARLRAANVALFDAASNSEMAIRLAAAWVFVQPSERPGFPFQVAYAMAAGVPCVVFDTACHRDVIKHGITGFIYRTESELVRHIAQLIDDEDLRARIGRAAREEAMKRFGAARFQTSLRRVYGMNRPGPWDEQLQRFQNIRGRARTAAN